MNQLVIELKFGKNRERVITDLKRVSKPGRRVYAKKDRLPRVLGGLGTAILSTSTGVITTRQAAERGVGERSSPSSGSHVADRQGPIEIPDRRHRRGVARREREGDRAARHARAARPRGWTSRRTTASSP